MIGKNLSAVFPNLRAENFAVSGTTSLHHFENQMKKLQQQPDEVLGVVVMTTGGNDIIHNYGRKPPKECGMYGATFGEAKEATFGEAKEWSENYRKRLNEMIVQIKERFPGGCEIFLANIYDPTDGTGSPGFTGLPDWEDGSEILKAYNEIITECAGRYEFVHLVNIHDTFLGHGIHCTKFWLKNYCLTDPHNWYYYNIEDQNNRGYDVIRRLFLLEITKVFYGNNLKEN